MNKKKSSLKPREKISKRRIVVKKSGAGFKKTFKNMINHAKKHVQKLKPKCKKAAIELAIAAAKEFASDLPMGIPRIIPVPKTGGFLPLIPIFAGLSTVGSLAGGAAGIAKAVSAINSAKKRLSKLKQSNEKMNDVCIGQGLQLKQHGSGLGIYTTQKN